MRIRSGHKPEDWIDCPPANPGSMPIRGAVVQGVSFKGPNRERVHTLATMRETPDNRGASHLESEVSPVSLPR